MSLWLIIRMIIYAQAVDRKSDVIEDIKNCVKGIQALIPHQPIMIKIGERLVSLMTPGLVFD